MILDASKSNFYTCCLAGWKLSLSFYKICLRVAADLLPCLDELSEADAVYAFFTICEALIELKKLFI